MVRATALCFASIPCVAASGDIPGYVIEIEAKRVQGSLFCYTRCNAEPPYPCLKLEPIEPHDSWQLAGETERRTMFIDPSCDFCGTGYETQYKNW